MKIISKNALIVFSVLFLSCSADDDGAQRHLDAARKYYMQKEFALATQEIDSIKILYPRSIEERKAGLALLDSVRRGENAHIIYTCDSLIKTTQQLVEQAKTMFIYQRNKEFQDTGSYIPKEMASGAIETTLLRSGVSEDGQLHIESVFIGSQRHRKLRVSSKDGAFAETLPVTDDGLNYRFSNMGKEYEIIRFAGPDENGVGMFISSNSDKQLTATLEGGSKYLYLLTQMTKSAILKSFQLSTMMTRLDSLKTEKEKAEFRIYNLDNKAAEANINTNH